MIPFSVRIIRSQNDRYVIQVHEHIPIGHPVYEPDRYHAQGKDNLFKFLKGLYEITPRVYSSKIVERIEDE